MLLSLRPGSLTPGPNMYPARSECQSSAGRSRVLQLDLRCMHDGSLESKHLELLLLLLFPPSPLLLLLLLLLSGTTTLPPAAAASC